MIIISLCKPGTLRVCYWTHTSFLKVSSLRIKNQDVVPPLSQTRSPGCVGSAPAVAARRGALRASPKLCSVLVYIASTASDGLNLGRPSGEAGGPRRLSSHNIIIPPELPVPKRKVAIILALRIS